MRIIVTGNMNGQRTMVSCGVLLIGLVVLGGGTGCDGGGGDPQFADILALEGDAMAGGTVFANACGDSICHGSDGVSGPAADLTVEVPVRTETELLDVMLNGSGDMLPLNLTDQQAADVLAYITETF